MSAQPWAPSNETLRVLMQVGYGKEIIDEEVVNYNRVAVNYPGVVQLSDKDFVLELRTKQFHKSQRIEQKFSIIGSWVPTNEEYEELKTAGYCKQIIDNQLGYFVLSRADSSRIIHSKFRLFKNYLQRKIPTQGIGIESWYPTEPLKSAISTELLVDENDYALFFDLFIAAFDKSSAENHHIPTFFFNFIKKNQAQIMKLSGRQ